MGLFKLPWASHWAQLLVRTQAGLQGKEGTGALRCGDSTLQRAPSQKYSSAISAGDELQREVAGGRRQIQRVMGLQGQELACEPQHSKKGLQAESQLTAAVEKYKSKFCTCLWDIFMISQLDLAAGDLE